MFKAIGLFAFGFVAMLAVALAESSQAIAEGTLVPQEDQMHALVNQERSAHGLAGLSANDALRTLGRRQSQAMAAVGYIFHTGDLGGAVTGLSLNWSLVGENVGVGPDVSTVQQAFQASPHHEENIVEPTFNALGIGAQPGDSGQLYFSQEFATLRGGGSAPRPAAKAVAPAVPKPAPAVRAAVAAVVATPRPVVATPTAAPVLPARDVTQTLDAYGAKAELASGAGAPKALEDATLPRTMYGMTLSFLRALAFWK